MTEDPPEPTTDRDVHLIDVVVDEGVLPAEEARRVLDPLRAAGVTDADGPVATAKSI